jgi:hypothetical protein
MNGSLELNPDLMSGIKKIFIQFIYKCILDKNKAILFISGDKLFKRLGHFKPVYEDISDAIMKVETSGKEEESLIKSYHLTVLGITCFFSDIEKKYSNIPIQFEGGLDTVSFKSLHDLILPSLKT